MSWVRLGTLPLALSLLACSSGEPGEPRASKRLDIPRHSQQAEATAAPLEPAQPALLEIDVGGTNDGGETVPVSPLSPKTRSLTWTERGHIDGRLEFVFVTSGVVARSPSGPRALDSSGELVARPKLDLPEGELLGYWPSSAWHIEVEDAEPEADEPRFSYQMSTYERGKWKVVRRRGAKRWHDGVIQFRKGWHGGLLLRKGTSISRIGSKRAKPRAGARKGKALVDMFETRAGRLYTVSSREGSLYVQANCSDLECVEANARRLPMGSNWRFSMHTPRRSNEASMLASVDGDEGERHYLLSHDRRGGQKTWVLEPLPEAPEGMWPDQAGGLWLLVDGQLWHRARGASWTKVELPDGGSELSVALGGDGPELWLALSSEAGTKLYTTAATPSE